MLPRGGVPPSRTCVGRTFWRSTATPTKGAKNSWFSVWGGDVAEVIGSRGWQRCAVLCAWGLGGVIEVSPAMTQRHSPGGERRSMRSRPTRVRGRRAAIIPDRHLSHS